MGKQVFRLDAGINEASIISKVLVEQHPSGRFCELYYVPMIIDWKECHHPIPASRTIATP